MNDRPKHSASLDTEVDRLRRRVAELEATTAEHQRAEHQLERDARLSEAALQLSQDTARAVLESASEGIILIDMTGHITLVNTAAERMFGYSRSRTCLVSLSRSCCRTGSAEAMLRIALVTSLSPASVRWASALTSPAVARTARSFRWKSASAT